MNNTIEYKGYIGTIEFSAEDALFYGKAQGIRALIAFEGKNAEELVSDFHGAVDDYLEMCEAEGIEPEKAYKGSFNAGSFPEHKQARLNAETIAAIKEVQEMKKNPSLYKKYSNVDELMADLLTDD